MNKDATNRSEEARAAKFAAYTALICAIITIVVQLAVYLLGTVHEKQRKVWEERRAALLSALQVIDHVYANSAFSGAPATSPHEWQLGLAWDAMNKLEIFCQNPNKAKLAFACAVGLRESHEAVVPYGPAAREEFRKVICEELDLPYQQVDVPAWIARLPGGK
jgi:hypothetical protein